MSWDFETDAEYAAKLEWAAELVRSEIEPLDLVLGDPFDKTNEEAEVLVAPLRRAVRDAGLWAAPRDEVRRALDSLRRHVAVLAPGAG
jgi:acyl-CoA dehydrogenase